MPYQPFLIAGFRTAKSIGLEPWLTPLDGFPTLENIEVSKGVFSKRLGYSPFATMKHGSTPQTDTTITGIHTYLKTNGKPKLLIMDTKRVNVYDAVNETTTDISGGSDIFTGGPEDRFHFCNWRGTGYMVNYKNQIYKYTGSGDVEAFNYQIDSTEARDNHLTTCRFIFVKDDRLIFLSTIEFGTAHVRRARYTPVLQTDGLAAGAGYVDAPTPDAIVSAGFVGKDIIVRFTNSLWRLKSTGNSDIPFKWDKLMNIEYSYSPYSGVEFDDGFCSVGTTHIDFFDNFKIRHIELENVRGIIDDFDVSGLKYISSYYRQESDSVLFTYASSGSTVPDRILEYNFLEKNWFVHKSNQSFFVNVIGGFTGESVATIGNIDVVHTGNSDAIGSDMDVAAIDILGNPTPFTLIGCRNSQIYKWGDGEFDATNDDSGKISIDSLSSTLNPFVKEGRKVSCSKIGFLVDNDASATFTASVYKNTGSVAYKTKTISCDSSDNTVDKFWVWIYCDGEIGNFHRIKISHTEKGNTPKIHALLPYFSPAERVNL